MDPFSEVQRDCWQQVNSLDEVIRKNPVITEDVKADFESSYQDLEETFSDLKQAIAISEQNPGRFLLTKDDINERKEVIRELKKNIDRIDQEWSKKMNNRKEREITSMSNRISQDFENLDNPFDDREAFDRHFNEYQEQEYIQSQDLQLDSIHATMQNLNRQAMMMGSELEDQGYMLDELDLEMDTVGGKLLRGLKRVNYVIEKNRETASNWCIGILIVVLCVLLVLLLIA